MLIIGEVELDMDLTMPNAIKEGKFYFNPNFVLELVKIRQMLLFGGC